nr:structural protein [Sobelivirales sp.]
MTKKKNQAKTSTPVNRGATSQPKAGAMMQKLDAVLSRIPKGAFKGAGSALGAKFGPAGMAAGGMLGSGLSAITGYGDYTVSSNSLSTVSTSVDMVPQFVKNEHSIRVKHREFIRDMLVPSNPQDFNLNDYVINPANKALFPWLNAMARQYSQYKIHGMVFAFKSMSSDYAASGPLGTVFMATNYNALDRPFTSKIELENCEFAVSTKPSMSLVHAIECDPKVSGFDILYVRDPGYDVPGEVSDRRFYDYGRFQVGTQGLPGAAGSTLGELWVSYDIELIKPLPGGSLTSGVTVVSKDNGELGQNPANYEFPRVTMTMPAIATLGASTNYNLVPTNGASFTGDVSLLGKVVQVDGSGVMRFTKNGNYTVVLHGNASTASGKSALGDTAGYSLSPTVSAVGKAWYNAASKTALPGSIQPYGVLLPPARITSAGGSAVPMYTNVIELRVYGIVDATTDYVSFSMSSLTTFSVAVELVTNLVRAATVTWSAFQVGDVDPGGAPPAPY